VIASDNTIQANFVLDTVRGFPHLGWDETFGCNEGVYYLEWWPVLPQTGGNKLIFLINQFLGL